MEYVEALKTVNAQKQKDNLMIIKLSWDTRLVLPFKDGLSFIASLANAELLSEPYEKQHSITEYSREAFETKVMSHAEYIRIKVAALLGVKPGDLVTPSPT